MTTPFTLQNNPITQLIQTVVGQSKTPAKVTTLPDNSKINKDVATFNGNQNVSTINQAITNNTTTSSRNISYQILAEPLKAVAPESIVDLAIAAVTTMAQGVLQQVNDKLTNAAALGQKPSAVNNQQIKDCIQSATNQCSDIVNTETKTAQLAHGHDYKVSFASHTVSANSIKLNSDTSIHNISPHINTSTQDYHLQANNSAVFVADINLNTYRQTVSMIEGASVTQAQTGLSVFTDTSDIVSQDTRSVGINSHSILGKQNNIIADTMISSVSGGDIQTASYGNMAFQGNGNISLVAAKSDKVANVNATGDNEGVSIPDSGGNIYIISKTSPSFSNIIGLTQTGIVNSTSGNSVTNSSGYTVVSGSQGATISSDNFAYVGTPDGGMFVKGRKMFLGNIAIPINSVKPPSIIDIPALPVFPSSPANSLANCIPKPKAAQFPTATGSLSPSGQFPTSTGTSTTLGTSSSNGTFPSAIGTSSSSSNGFPAVNTSPSTIQSVDSNISLYPDISQISIYNKKSLAKESNINSTSGNQNADKLPPPANSATEKKVAAIDAAAILGGPPGIYTEAYSTANNSQLVDLITYQDMYNTSSLIDTLSQSDDITALATSLSSLDDALTIDNLTSYLSSAVPAKVLPSLLKPNFYQTLFNLPTDKVDNFTFTVNDFAPIDQPDAKVILNLIQQYPALKTNILNFINSTNVIAAIGFLDALSSITGFNPNIALGITNNSAVTGLITAVPKVVTNPNISGITSLLSNTINAISPNTQNSTFANLLNNPNLLNLGQSLLSGNQANISKALNTSVDNILTSQLTQTVTNNLGASAASVIPLLKSVLTQTKVGSNLNASVYINQFSQIINSTLGNNLGTKASSIYNDLQGLIKNINTGNVTAILSGGNITDIVSNLLGSNNAGSVSKLLTLTQQAIGTYQALSLLPQVLSLLNNFSIPSLNQVSQALNCLDLFNKVKDLLATASSLGGSNQGATSALENTGRLVQGLNTLSNIDNSSLAAIQQTLPNTPDLVNLKNNISFNLNLDTCFKVPQLTMFQSDVTVQQFNSGRLIFSLTNYSSFANSPSLLPKLNDIIQLNVAGFLYSRSYYTLYQTDFQYTPSVYNFLVTDYNIATNVGVAIFDNSISSITLEDSTGTLYQFSSSLIGTSLIPDIQDSYILK